MMLGCRRALSPRGRLLLPVAVRGPLPPRRCLAQASGRNGGGWWSDNNSVGAGMLAVALGTLGLSYASVPLYRMFCQATGFGGTVKTHNTKVDGGEDEGYNLPADPKSLPNNRMLKVTFNTDVDAELPWSFKPVQRSISVMAGQTALAFFEATNRSAEPIIGVATYNVAPMQAGAYFNKIQAGSGQRLLPGETVDMPVFFYVDPEFLTDRRMKNINTMTLSYTFFRSSDWESNSTDPRPSGVYYQAPVAVEAHARTSVEA